MGNRCDKEEKKTKKIDCGALSLEWKTDFSPSL
jgi:hypothetical protein